MRPGVEFDEQTIERRQAEGRAFADELFAPLGRAKEYAPILATPIGDGLTKQEERWNEREKKEGVKLEERQRRTVSESRIGEKLRKWEIDKMDEDFKLIRDEKAELLAAGLDSG